MYINNKCRFSGLLIYFSIINVFVHVNGLEYLVEKPSYIKTCKIYEPEFTKCSTESIQNLLQELVKGIPEFKGLVPEMDPVHLDKIIFKQDNNEAATISANLTDLIVRGFKKMRIKESKVSKKDLHWQTKIFIPLLRLEGKYKMDGRILLIPLQGSGNMFIELENLDLIMYSKTRLYEKGGFTFYNVTDIRVDLDMTGVKTNFENIFNGNSKEVERQTNELFNTNWRDFFEALRPIVTDTVEKTLKSILQPLFHVIPANFLVEDIPTSEKLYGQKNS